MHYLSSPEIREQLHLLNVQFEALFEGALTDLAAMGGDSNERITALANWAALAVDKAVQRLVANPAPTGQPLTFDMQERVAMAICADVQARALTLLDLRRGEADAPRQ